jgi:arsenite methyltransferase
MSSSPSPRSGGNANPVDPSTGSSADTLRATIRSRYSTAARQVSSGERACCGPTGHVCGLDMTDEMLTLARSNQRKAGITNEEFLKGEIEAIPLPDASADVIISNCVINLAADKGRGLREAFRVLRPGGRFAVSDVVIRGDMPAGIRRSMEPWIGCVAGALEETEYRHLLADAGFVDIEVEPTRIYGRDDVRALLATDAGIDETADEAAAEAADEAVIAAAAERFMSAFVRAGRPKSGTPGTPE